MLDGLDRIEHDQQAHTSFAAPDLTQLGKVH
jgi:hypothetical protein